MDEYEPLVHQSSGTSDLDGVLLASSDHYLLFWTLPLDGRREIVGLEVVPRPSREPANARLVKSWLLPRLTALERSLPAEVAPVSAALLRTLPLRELMAHRDRLAGKGSGDREYEVVTEDGESAGLDRSEIAKLDSLQDALLYVSAISRGVPPAPVIADYRTISARTAQSRVARARQLGFLTPATGRHASGELTEKALDLLDRVRRFGAIGVRESGGREDG